MEKISPAGPVYQAGTLSGNPLAMAGGLATLEILQEPGAYQAIERRSGMLAEGLIDAAARAGVPVTLNRVASMLTPFFLLEPGRPVNNFADATSGNADAYARFFHAMLENGVFLPPSQYEAFFVGLAHTDEVIERTIRAAEKSFAAVEAVGK
jgi:glutamate-1-semialdehyde 2,1-aminomutase